MTIKAIETRYDGYKFRSRLEARWAVFFNELRIDWEYEPEGFTVDTPRGRINYLPDFWLGTGQWAEVKGFLDPAGMSRLYALACGMSLCGSGHDLVVFGDVPRLHSIAWPVQLHYHRRLWGVAWRPEPGCPMKRPHVAIEDSFETGQRLTDGFPFGVPDWAQDGLRRAREARFEWGESG
jgi:hypothetical protein